MIERIIHFVLYEIEETLIISGTAVLHIADAIYYSRHFFLLGVLSLIIIGLL